MTNISGKRPSFFFNVGIFVINLFTDEDIESQIKLLPPSEFEKPKKKAENDSSWLELKKAADEILALRTENQKLR